MGIILFNFRKRCNQFVTKDMYPSDLEELDKLENQPDIMCRGGSVIVSLSGHVLAGPLFDKEGILYANLDLSEVIQSKLDFDVVGHYARPDIFQFIVNKNPRFPVVKNE